MTGRASWVGVESPHPRTTGCYAAGLGRRGDFSMNGRVANSTLSSRRTTPLRNIRTLLLTAACVMSLALLGAVRLAPQLRPDPLMAVAEAPVAGWDEPAFDETESSDGPVMGTINAADEESTLVSGVLPQGMDLLPTRAPVLTPPGQVIPTPAPSPRLPPAPAPVRPRTRTMLMEVTAYCPCPRCCGPRAQGITASGRRVSYNGGKFVAADTKVLKFNTKLMIPGYADGRPVEVIDRGGAIKGNKLDVYFPTHQEARKWGRRKILVTVLDQ